MFYPLTGLAGSLAKESLRLQKQSDSQQWAESSDQQRDFHAQGRDLLLLLHRHGSGLERP